MKLLDDRRSADRTFGRADHSIALMRHGYRFWEVMRDRTGEEVVQLRVLNERLTAVGGEDAARFFYGEPGTERSSALPGALVTPLFGKGPVHQLDGEPHAHRKSMFDDVLGPEAISSVTASVARHWDDLSPTWGPAVDVHGASARILFHAAAEWVGTPTRLFEDQRRTGDMIAMVDGFGAPAPRQVSARIARRATDRWVGAMIDASRGDGPVDDPRPIDVIAQHRDAHGRLLSRRTAAVETINLVRPLVAVSWLVSAMVRAMSDNPGVRQAVLADQLSALDVAQEVRRTAPFVPFLATRATRDLRWRGFEIPRGTLLVLDVWGTNHDPAAWERPDSFDPTRFASTPVTPFNLVPQGGGHRETGHRCPGEDMTSAVLMTLVKRVAQLPVEHVEPLAGLRRMPPVPRCRVTLTAESARRAGTGMNYGRWASSSGANHLQPGALDGRHGTQAG